MIRLHGFPVSNYVNMVHFVLLEKAILFEYVLCYPEQSEAPAGRKSAGQGALSRNQ